MQISSRINYTGRHKINRSEVQITIDYSGAQVPSFNAAFMFKDSRFPGEADLYVEAYHKNTSQRFGFGTVGAPVPPVDTSLGQIDLSGPVLFRVKIVDNSGHVGRLLAAAEGLRPDSENDEENKASLMTIKTTDLGQVTWNLAFSEDKKPVLCINSRIPEAKSQLLSNPKFQSLILPAALREVLMFVLWNNDGEADEESWQRKWLQFANHIAPVELDESGDPIQVLAWIDDVVAAFSERFELCELLIKKMEEAAA